MSKCESSKLSNLSFEKNEEKENDHSSISLDWILSAQFDENMPANSYKIYASCLLNNLLVDFAQYPTYQDFFCHLFYFISQTNYIPHQSDDIPEIPKKANSGRQEHPKITHDECILKLQDILNILSQAVQSSHKNANVVEHGAKRQKLNPEDVNSALKCGSHAQTKSKLMEVHELVCEIVDFVSTKLAVPETCKFEKSHLGYSDVLKASTFNVHFHQPVLGSCITDTTKNTKNVITWRKLASPDRFLNRLSKNLKYSEGEFCERTWSSVDISVKIGYKEVFVYRHCPNIESNHTSSYAVLPSICIYESKQPDSRHEFQQRSYTATLLHFNYNDIEKIKFGEFVNEKPIISELNRHHNK